MKLASFPIMMAAVIALSFVPCSAKAGNYGVSPLDFQFTAQRKSGVLTVSNEDQSPISLRVRAMRWTQGANGEDIYEESSDLVFFPKRVDMQPGESKIIRLGVNVVQQDKERAYRLFVDELPPPESPDQPSGTRLSVLVSMGVPVFLTPEGAKPLLKVERASLGDGLEMTVINEGATRVRMSRIVDREGSEISQNIPGRYVFPGVRKELRVPAESLSCGASLMPLRVDTDGVMTEFNAACAN